MSRVIWKFELVIMHSQLIEMPCDARILSAQVQNGKLCIWAIVCPGNESERREIYILGTGNPITNDDKYGFYIDTVQIDGFVWHVFEGK